MDYTNVRSYAFYEMAMRVLLAKNEEELLNALDHIMNIYIESASLHKFLEDKKLTELDYKKVNFDELMKYVFEKRNEEIQVFDKEMYDDYFKCDEETYKRVMNAIKEFNFKEESKLN